MGSDDTVRWVKCDMCRGQYLESESDDGLCVHCGSVPQMELSDRFETAEEFGYRRGFHQGFLTAMCAAKAGRILGPWEREIAEWRRDPVGIAWRTMPPVPPETDARDPRRFEDPRRFVLDNVVDHLEELHKQITAAMGSKSDADLGALYAEISICEDLLKQLDVLGF